VNVERVEEPAGPIRVDTDETFSIELSGNPSTGYLWEADVDARYLELTEQGFELEGAAIGAGGREVFHFRAREVGKTEIVFAYRRAWEESVRDTRRFEVVIG
jgi:predicted secreted protein